MHSIEIDPKTKIWEGQFPKGVTQVASQYLDSNGTWQPPLSKAVISPRKEAIGKMERAVHKGPCKFDKYRLVAVQFDSVTNSTQEVDHMAAKKKVAVKAKGGLQAGSLRLRVVELLNDGKKRKGEDIIKAVKGNPGSRSVMTFLKPIIISLDKVGVTIEGPDDEGFFSMKKGSYTPPEPESEPEAAAPKKKAVKKAAGRRAPTPTQDEEDSLSVDV